MEVTGVWLSPDRMWKKDQRVELVRCSDPHTDLAEGDRGTVMFVDSARTVHVAWDRGSCLGMCEDAGDKIRVVTDA